MSKLDELFNDKEGDLFAYAAKDSAVVWPPDKEQSESGAAIWRASRQDDVASRIRQKFNLDPDIRILRSPNGQILAHIIANMRPHFNDPSEWPHFGSILTGGYQTAKQPTQYDFALAQKVRVHFSDVLMDILSGKQVSKFRKDAYSFVNDMQEAVPETHLGLAVKLPGFYLYDQHLRALGDTFDCTPVGEDGNTVYLGERTFVGRYVDRTFIWTKRSGREYQYWIECRDPKFSGRLLMLSVAEGNPLLTLLDDYIRSNEIVSIHGLFTFKQLLRSTIHCINATNWSIAPNNLNPSRK